MQIYRPLWAEIDLAALRYNFAQIKKCVGKKVKIMAIVKQAAYGHGLIPVAKQLSKLKADFFGVESIEEAVNLRAKKIKEPILILTAVLPEYAAAFIKYNLRPTVVNFDFAKALNREALQQNKKVPIHIKIDTGMGRLGLCPKEALGLVKQIKGLKNLYCEGIYTHFPAADSDKRFTKSQVAIFKSFIKDAKDIGINFKYKHCANSAALFNLPETHFNMVRPGLALYGIKPSLNLKISLKPALTLKSKIVFVKPMVKNSTVSYGRTYKIKKTTSIATVAVGYADGYPWSAKNKAKVIIKNREYPIAGRICMDHVMVDLGNRKGIKIGEEVVLIDDKKATAQKIADWSGTIPYEIISRISFRVPRIYKNAQIKRRAYD